MAAAAVAAPGSQPEWLRLFCTRAPAEEVAAAWKNGFSPEEAKEAEADAPTARARLRRAIVDCEEPEVRADAADGWRYTGSVIRAADAVLGIPPPKPRAIASQQPAPAASGSGAAAVSREVVKGEGKPGSLGIWWSDFGGANDLEQLRQRGITRRLNVAKEAVGKFSEEGDIPISNVPMEDIFDEDKAVAAISTWIQQLKEVLGLLRAWREEGQVVNVSCQMGKNRSGCSILMWLCSDGGWKVGEAVDQLRRITALACANPHLIKAVTDSLGVDADVPLNPAGDGGGWVCISPPGSPRAGGAQEFEDVAKKAFEKLAGMSGTAEAPKEQLEEKEEDSEDEDVVPIFEGLSDVD